MSRYYYTKEESLIIVKYLKDIFLEFSSQQLTMALEHSMSGRALRTGAELIKKIIVNLINYYQN